MRITLSLPDSLAQRFLASIPIRERSATVARLLEKELAEREKALQAACLAANKDAALASEIEEWQAFDDNQEEPVN
jgi:metal-responsive CopG/Arc/MetJ family transcriptional regulator